VFVEDSRIAPACWRDFRRLLVFATRINIFLAVTTLTGRFDAWFYIVSKIVCASSTFCACTARQKSGKADEEGWQFVVNTG